MPKSHNNVLWQGLSDQFCQGQHASCWKCCRLGSAELASPRATGAGAPAPPASGLSAGPWSAGGAARGEPSGASRGAGAPAAPPASTAAPAQPTPAEAVSRADAGAGALAGSSAGGVDSGDRQAPAGAAAAPASTPFAEAAGAGFGDAGRASSGGSAEGPLGALGVGSQPSARRPELDPFDIAAHSAVPPGALTPAVSSKPSAGSPSPAKLLGASGSAGGDPAEGAPAQSDAPLSAASDRPLAPAAERLRPPALEVGGGASPPPVEGVVRVTSSEFSPLGAGPLGQAAALKRGPSPPPAAPRQAVH